MTNKASSAFRALAARIENEVCAANSVPLSYNSLIIDLWKLDSNPKSK